MILCCAITINLAEINEHYTTFVCSKFLQEFIILDFLVWWIFNDGRIKKKKIYIIIIFSGPEYGTTEAAWKGVCGEADKRHDLHMR